MGIEDVVEDWPTVKKRWEAWWQGGMYDRPLVAVTAPRKGAGPRIDEAVDVVTQWTDPDYMVRHTLEIVRTTYYGGEALPVFWHNWSAGHSLYLGCQPHFAPDTVWVDPAPNQRQDDGHDMRFDGWRQSPWWAWMLHCTDVAAQASRGRYFVMPMWGNHAGDNLGLVRGTQRLLTDIATRPQWVRRAAQTLSDIQRQVFEELWPRVAPGVVGVEGSINYVNCWSPGRTMAFDCDLSCMISDEDFKTLFLPPLLETMATVDHRIYHLDGWVALHHLDTLLDVPELHAIQWLPGAGREEIGQWLPVIRRMQSRGKRVAVYVTPEEVDLLLREVRPEGLFINATCRGEGEARSIIDHVAGLF